jgi:hypothetical protein
MKLQYAKRILTCFSKFVLIIGVTISLVTFSPLLVRSPSTFPFCLLPGAFPAIFFYINLTIHHLLLLVIRFLPSNTSSPTLSPLASSITSSPFTTLRTRVTKISRFFLKITEFTVHRFKILEKDKNQ